MQAVNPAYVFYSLNIIGNLTVSIRDIEGNEIYTSDYITDEIKNLSANVNVIVFAMFNCFSIDLHPVILRDIEFLKTFDHHIFFHGMEPCVKSLDDVAIEGAEYQPVYEFLTIYHSHVNPKTLEYIDNDFTIQRSLRKWSRSLKSKPKFTVSTVDNLLYGNVLLYHTSMFYNSKTDASNFFKTTFQEIRSSYKYTHLYTSFNRQRRWGRELLFYSLWKNDLLDDGIVSMHQNFYNLKFLKICQKFNLEVYESEIDQLNKLLPIKIDNIEIPNSKLNHETYKNFILNFYAPEMFMAPISVVTETFFVQKIVTHSEKILRPVLLGQIILPVATYNLCHQLSERFGFKFSKATLEIDKIEDPIKRIDAVIEKLKFFKNDQKSLYQELDYINDNYNHNLDMILLNSSDNILLNIKKLVKKYV
jgi:hypothetical protein